MLVTVVGLSNVGKSTLINSIIGRKVTIVTPKLQTTRTKVKFITTSGNTQIVLIDSPGVFSAKTTLERSLMKATWSAISSDVITLFVIDASNCLKRIERIKTIFMQLQYLKAKCVLVINKIDLIKKYELNVIYEHFNSFYGFERIFIISALKYDDRLSDLVNYLSRLAPLSPWAYRKNQVTDSSLSFLLSEITREKLFLNLYEELPYSIAVRTERIQKKSNDLIIEQIIFVLRNSQKKIVLGKNGNNIKMIGIKARIELEKLLKCNVHLFLFVKVLNWVEHPEEYIMDRQLISSSFRSLEVVSNETHKSLIS